MHAAPGVLHSETLDSTHIVLTDGAFKDQDLIDQAASETTLNIQFNSATDSAEDVIAKITEWSNQTQRSINSISILSHGQPGSFQLGYERITANSIQTNLVLWKTLTAVLASNANLYIYGCESGSGEQGQQLLDTLSSVTAANVFASNNTTGFGNDWNLEVASVGAPLVLSSGLNTPLIESELAFFSETLDSYTAKYPTTAGTGTFISAANGLADNGLWTSATTNGESQIYQDFVFALPGSPIIAGLTVEFELRGSGPSTGYIGASFQLSWDGGTNWSDLKTDSVSCAAATCPGSMLTLGGLNDKWGAHNWVFGEFTDANFRLKVEKAAGSETGTLEIDYVTVQVHYVGSVDFTQSSIVASSASIVANGAALTTLTVQAKDSDGNNLTTGGLVVTFNPDSVNPVISSTTDNADGTYTATVTSTVPEVVNIGASMGGNVIASSAFTSITFTQDFDITKSTITAAVISETADGSTTILVTLQAIDSGSSNLQ